ncbi:MULTISPECIES: CDP-diacylglycerol--glycerol-3-phosphate 3-phosphatidyltransferase [unclassified Microbacterium]|uniref:CDP-diacylglycerol--glycerol-3-phosphate 3-phosphatidyltransferase n=1 Tax=unclassified Microbacterium TaxID=2609290 RepID=UPI001604E825|nr:MULTISPECIES: CDP-diacylglycerol--glycerol-3-phosphate 3-phosphatidyltransferase [unclassified Microbacterium]QNA92457.1 CDP-diacylglycerol--glycerol-3-phosphate 3-phosphatidyltransferase [Microbacterium sp. Se63.02b]QYM65751.1 CDP-diacylglycerol--glycerol-3-phosphate 3-phosphatidyltransferase [Microbacterium sp. Se5.02b]
MTIPRQLPNAITVARIPLAVIFFVLLLLGGTYGDLAPALRWTAAILFIVGISTDWVDGYLARKYDIVSDFGKLWDPIADKMLTGAGFIGLAILGEVSWWIVAIILVREWGITVHRLMVASEHVVAAAWMGKIKTAFQGVALGWALLPLHVLMGLEAWTLVTLVLMIIVLVLTVASGVDYIVAQVRGSRQKRA